MKIVFWQNIISIHQVPFIRELAENHKVSLFVEEYLNPTRHKEGWEIPDIGNIVVKKVTAQNYQTLLNNHQEHLHFFSGLYSYPILTKVILKAMKLNLFVGVIAEPQNYIGVKGFLNLIRSRIFTFLYGHKIILILAIGSKGKWWYRRIGFHPRKIFPWGYCVEKPNLSISVKRNSSLPRLLYVGRIVSGKGLRDILKALNESFSTNFLSFDIVGDGPDMEEIKKIVANSKIEDKVRIHGQVRSSEVWKFYQESDFTLLPSKYKDGWGAVINESLLSGVPVITTTNCGASLLIRNNNGYVYKAGSYSSLKETLNVALKNKSIYSLSNKKNIQRRAESVLSGKSYKLYFEKIVEKYPNGGSEILPPWEKVK